MFPAKPWTLCEDKQTERLFVHAPSLATDNPFIDSDAYLRNLRAACAGDPEVYEAWAEGSWTVNRARLLAGCLDYERNATEPWKAARDPRALTCASAWRRNDRSGECFAVTRAQTGGQGQALSSDRLVAASRQRIGFSYGSSLRRRLSVANPLNAKRWRTGCMRCALGIGAAVAEDRLRPAPGIRTTVPVLRATGADRGSWPRSEPEEPRMRNAFLLAALTVFLTSPAQADFIGRTMSATYFFPDAATPYAFASFAPGTFVVGAGQETVGDVEGVTTLTVDFDGASLSILLDTVLTNPTWNATAFNGIIFGLLSPGALDILSATVDASTTMAGFDATRVTFTDSSIGIDWNGLSYVDGTVVRISFAFAPQSVPEPGVAWLLAIGFAASAARRTLRGR